MKITIKPDNTVIGKNKSYIASLVTFSAKGITKDEAKQNLMNVLTWMDNNALYPQTVIRQIPDANRTIILERSNNGYSVIVNNQDDTTSRNQNCSLYGFIGHTEALKKLEQHVQNYTS
ncbi:hypothetical protein ACH6EH_06825 [Paenibacillus sp. JSM ZJ436]|uniref:hypothetical protein n=1 Tax=Paenibacillus sp. JSM ZJ436 TaxID=3376190 RepID=UPI0037A5D8AD